MKEEYASLRQEISEWQNRRFLLVGTSITLVTGILGIGLGVLKDLWIIASSLLLMFLTCAIILSWYAGRANAKISAYLVVFHSTTGSDDKMSGWESRLIRLKKKPKVDFFTLNHVLVAIYTTLGIMSVLIPWLVAGKPTTSLEQIPILVTALLFVGSLILQWKFSYPRDGYVKHWMDVKKEEQ
jgi:type IV secretory pathway TrbD component